MCVEKGWFSKTVLTFVSSIGGQYLRVTHFLASRQVSRISEVINGSHHWTKEKLITRDLLVPTVNI